MQINLSMKQDSQTQKTNILIFQRYGQKPGFKEGLLLLFCHSVVSDSLRPHQAPLSMGFSQPRILEWVAIAFSCFQEGVNLQYFIVFQARHAEQEIDFRGQRKPGFSIKTKTKRNKEKQILSVSIEGFNKGQEIGKQNKTKQ